MYLNRVETRNRNTITPSGERGRAERGIEVEDKVNGSYQMGIMALRANPSLLFKS
jgi:hypothetical protein